MNTRASLARAHPPYSGHGESWDFAEIRRVTSGQGMWPVDSERTCVFSQCSVLLGKCVCQLPTVSVYMCTYPISGSFDHTVTLPVCPGVGVGLSPVSTLQCRPACKTWLRYWRIPHHLSTYVIQHHYLLGRPYGVTGGLIKCS